MTGKRRQGIDPIAERDAAEALAKQTADAKARELAKDAARMTVNALFERWASVDLLRHKDGGAYVRDHMTRHVLPAMGELLVEDVRKVHILSLIHI